MMRRRYVTLDVFTDQAFGGNPLAVVLDAQGLDTAQMQALAAEFNYSETTFVLPPAEARHTAAVRIFTPQAELPFAGHPNVGTGFVLAQQGGGEALVFEEAAGLVNIRVLREAGAVVGAELTAPQPLSRGTTFPAGQVAAALGLAASAVALARHPPCVASVGLPFLVVELAAASLLDRIRPDAAAFAALLPEEPFNSIFAYATEPAATAGEARVQARMFMQMGGLVIEDPATGSAAAALAALLADLDRHGPERLLVRQGVAMGRPSLLQARIRREAGRVAGIDVGGRCVPMFEGSFVLA